MNNVRGSALRAAAGMLLAFALLLPPPADAQDAKTEILWLGQSAMRIKTPGGKVIVTDPWLISNPKTPAQYKDLDALGKVDLVLVSHAHFDHFEDAPALAKRNNAPIVTPAGLQSTMLELDLVPANLAYRVNKGSVFMPIPGSNIKVWMVHAEHDSELVYTNPTTKKREVHVGGEPVGYIIELENGFKIWHMGDTGLFGDMRLIGETYKPDLVLIPIGGHFTMGPQDAAIAVRELIKPRYAMPMHYGTFPLLRGTPAEFSTALGSASATRVVVPEPGQKVESLLRL